MFSFCCDVNDLSEFAENVFFSNNQDTFETLQPKHLPLNFSRLENTWFAILNIYNCCFFIKLSNF